MTMYSPHFYCFLLQHFIIRWGAPHLSHFWQAAPAPLSCISSSKPFLPHFPGWPFMIEQHWITDWPNSSPLILAQFWPWRIIESHDGAIRIYWLIDIFHGGNWNQQDGMAICSGLNNTSNKTLEIFWVVGGDAWPFACEKLAGVRLNAGKAKSHPGRLHVSLHSSLAKVYRKVTFWTFSLHPFLC